MYQANPNRYYTMKYRRLGKSGLKLPLVSLGFWYNFGEKNNYDECKAIVLRAFDAGITHFDFANNYGPPPGYAESVFGRILKEELLPYRDEIIISTKAGFGMWPGPYGDGGSRKYLMASLDQSLARLGVPYVDIFYHHRWDGDTNLEETMVTLRDIVLSGKALYVGLSNYNSAQLKQAQALLKEMKVPFVITQPNYSMLDRWIEKDGILDTQADFGAGVICYSALAQGRLSNKYIEGVPEDSRAAKPEMVWFNRTDITTDLQDKLRKLKVIADQREQTISQMALSWVLRDPRMTSTLIGVSKLSQLEENLAAIKKIEFTPQELAAIEDALK